MTIGITHPAQFFRHHDSRIVVSMQTDCWHWVGATSHAGYGEVKINGKRDLAHRVAYQAINGPIPRGLMVRHSCDRPTCVNPVHLQVGTQAENMQDMVSRGRQSKGHHRPYAKLTDGDVRAIRNLLKQGKGHSAIARQFGVSTSRISKINTGKIWRHVE